MPTKRLSPLLTLVILFALAIALFVGVRLIGQTRRTTSQAAGNPTLTFVPATNTTPVPLNGEFDTYIHLSTDPSANPSGIRGVDVVLAFNDTYLEPVEFQPLATTTSLKTYAPLNSSDGTFNFTAARLDTNSNSRTDRIEFGTVTYQWGAPTPITAPFNGSGQQLARIRFRVRQTGVTSTPITIVHTPGTTNDSNITSALNPPTDILNSVTNFTVSLGGGPAATLTPTPSLILAYVQINPGHITTTTTSAPVNLSAQAFTTNGIMIPSGISYEWGISSSGSIGQLTPNPSNPKLATFVPRLTGTGSIWVIARDSQSRSANKSAAVTLTAAPTSTPTTTIPPVPPPFLKDVVIHLQNRTTNIGNSGAKVFYFTFKQGSFSESHSIGFNAISTTNPDFRGSLSTNLVPGIFDVFIKTDGYLQKKYSGIILNSGYQTPTFSAPLLAGDFVTPPNSTPNVLTIADVGDILSRYTGISTPMPNSIYDLNGDGNLTATDIGIVLSNYTTLSVPGDQ